MDIKIKLIEDGKVPEYKTENAACADCYARLATPFITIPSKTRALVNLGFALELPKGYEAVIRPRSSLTLQGIDIGIATGLTLEGFDMGVGTIDADYRGEVKACVINNSDGPFTINYGDRICQLKIQKADQFTFVTVDNLSETTRGQGGFGSTGIKN